MVHHISIASKAQTQHDLITYPGLDLHLLHIKSLYYLQALAKHNLSIALSKEFSGGRPQAQMLRVLERRAPCQVHQTYP